MPDGIGTTIGYPIGQKPFSFSSGIGLGIGEAGGGSSTPVISQFRANGIQNRAPDERRAATGSKTSFVQKEVKIIGSNADVLVFNLPNYYQNTTAESAPGNALYWDEMAVKYNGVWKTVIADGAGLTIANGDHTTLTSYIYASDFGASYFAQDAQLLIKARGHVPAAGYRVYASGLYEGWVTDFQIEAYDPALTTPSACAADGDFTATGTAFTNDLYLSPIIVFGRPLSYSTSFIMGVGSSIAQGFGDGGSNSYWGKGYLARSSHAQTASSTATPPGGSPPYTSTGNILNFARGASDTRLQVNGTRWQWYLPFVDTFVASDGANDYQNYASYALLMAAQESVIDEASTATGSNVAYVIVPLPAAYASSTDTYLTAANQTPLTNWGDGEWTMQARAAYLTHLQNGIIDGLCYPEGIVDPAFPYKFLTNGVTSKLVNYDTIHWNERGEETMGEHLRTQYTGVRQPLPFAIPFYSTPSISGTGGVGNTLTISTGTYGNMQSSKTPSYTYKWYRDGVEVAGQTASTYVQTYLDMGKTITAGVTTTNAYGSLSEIVTSGVSTPYSFVSSGLVAEYRGQDYNSGTGDWTDNTGVTGTAVQGTSGNRPGTVSVNGVNCPDFDGTDDWVTPPAAISTLMQATAFWQNCWKTDTPTASQTIGSGTSGSTGCNYDIGGTGDRIYARAGDNFAQLLSITVTSGVHVGGLQVQSTDSRIWFEATKGSAFNKGGTGPTSFAFGRSSSGFGRFNGAQCHHLFYNRVLTDDEYLQNRAYLHYLYG